MSRDIQDSMRALVKRALQEDDARRDCASMLTIPRHQHAAALIVAKQTGVLAGGQCVREVFAQLDETIEVKVCVEDGRRFRSGETLFRISGNCRRLLAGERTALNFLQHLSGIASMTKRYVDQVRGTRSRIYDTRKTTPAYRRLEKYAVRMGGGCNHRTGLSDMVLLKENHLLAVRSRPGWSLQGAIARWKKTNPGVPVEIETDDMKQLHWAISLGADIIMLDNMSPSQIRRAVREASRISRGKRPVLEASGGISLKNVRRYADTGVDRIAVGALTHSAPACDLAMYLHMCEKT